MDWTLPLGERRGGANFAYLGEASLAVTEMLAVGCENLSSFFFLPCLCSNSSPHYNRQEVESERKFIGMQRQCIYNYNVYLVTMLKQRPPSPHAREHSFPPSHSHDVIAASPGCTVFLLFITHIRCQLHCFSHQHTCSHLGEEEELPFPRPLLLLQRQVSQGFCVWAAKITPGSDAGLEERERRKDLLRTREPEQTFFFPCAKLSLAVRTSFIRGSFLGRANRIA